MGLDSVEIVMEVEEKFGIELSDEEATSVRTVGDLYGVLIVKGVALPMDAPCHSRRVFGLVRDVVRRHAEDAPRRLRPATSLSDCLGQQTTKEFWSRLRRDTSWDLPELVRPAVLETVIGATAVTAGALTWVVLSFQPSGLWGWGVALGAFGGYAVGLIVHTILQALTRPACRELPVRDLRELTSRVLHRNHEALADVLHRPVLTDEWQKIRAILSEQLGITPLDIYPESRLVEDLGMD